ncbi:MAG: hypothetical protein K8J09_13700 [Planctomycetes bacterium]|nr:hypothetical protein [Planctomycetota bacterium]MCC7398245.1 hypothetical protein [Planctomycetota bacterium]
MRRSLLPALLLAACATGGGALYLAVPFLPTDFACSDPSRWRWRDLGDGAAVLQLLPGSDYRPPFRSPLAITLLRSVELRDFDLELDLLQTGRDYGHRDLCLVLGFESNARFCYVHLAQAPDPHAHNVFRVADADRVALLPVPARGIEWGDRWHHVRLERRTADGSITVYWDRAKTPILRATCRDFEWGRIGFGSFDDEGRFANLRLTNAQSRPGADRGDPFGAR